MTLNRYRMAWRALACGAIALGWWQALGRVPFGDILTQFLITLFSALVTALMGGTVTATA